MPKFIIFLGILLVLLDSSPLAQEGVTIELGIVVEFPAGEPIAPEIATLDGQDVRTHTFPPGKYLLDIRHPGFVPIREEVVIPAGSGRFAIARTLKPKPRVVHLNITHDTPPPEHLAPYRITLAPMDNPQAEQIIKHGDEIRPFAYIIKISQEAYQPIEQQKYVFPDDLPLVIEAKLVAKPVPIVVHVVYDIEPTPDVSECRASFTDDPDVGRPPKVVPCHGEVIKPGHYLLDIRRPGYSFETRKKIEILPSEQPWQIEAKLVAKPRPLYIFYEYDFPVITPNYEVVNAKTGKDITLADRFRPGEEVEFIVISRLFKTVRSKDKITPGEGPICVRLSPPRLKKYEFTSREHELELDKIKYPYVLYSDSQQIEAHLIECEKGPGGRFMYTMRIEPEAKNLVVFAGYRYAQVPFDKIRVSGISGLDNISLPKLIEHLEQVARNDQRAYLAALEVMEKLLQSSSQLSKICQCPAVEIQKLVEYMESWQLEEQDKERVKRVREILEKN